MTYSENFQLVIPQTLFVREKLIFHGVPIRKEGIVCEQRHRTLRLQKS